MRELELGMSVGERIHPTKENQLSNNMELGMETGGVRGLWRQLTDHCGLIV